MADPALDALLADINKLLAQSRAASGAESAAALQQARGFGAAGVAPGFTAAVAPNPLLEPPQRPGFIAPQPAPAFGGLPEAPAPRGILRRTMPTFAPGIEAVGRTARFGAKALPVVGGALAAAPAALSVMDVAADPERTKIDVATEAAKQTARLAGATGAGLFAAQAAAPLAPFTLGAAPLIAGGAAGTAAYFAPEILDWVKNKFPGGATPVATPATGTHAIPERSVFAPAVAPTAGPLTGPPSPQDLQEEIRGQSKAADQLLGAVDKMVGRSGGTAAGANERIRGLASNPAALETFNAAQGLNRTGIVASRDAKGQLVLGSDPNAQPNVYFGPDGRPVSRYEDSAQYAQGVELAAKERAQLGAIELKGELAEQLSRARNAKTVPGKRLETELYAAMATNQVSRENALRLGAVEGRKAGIEERKLQLDAIRTMADAGDKNAQTLVRQLTLRAIAKGDTDTALILQGKEPRTDKFVFDPTQIVTRPNEPRTVMNTSTGQPLQVVPKRVATRADLASDMAKKKLSREEVIRLYEAQNIDTSELK